MNGTSFSIATVIDSRSLTAKRFAHVTRLPRIFSSFMRSTPGSGSAAHIPLKATSRGTPASSATTERDRDVLLERDVVELLQLLVGDRFRIGDDQTAAALGGDLLHDRHDQRIAFGGDQHAVVRAGVQQRPGDLRQRLAHDVLVVSRGCW